MGKTTITLSIDNDICILAYNEFNDDYIITISKMEKCIIKKN